MKQRAVEMPAACITSFAKTLLASIRAAAEVGPKHRNPLASKTSTIPSASALSGKFSVQSLIFEVTVYAEIGKTKKQFKALIRRASARDIQVLYMYEYVETKSMLRG